MFALTMLKFRQSRREGLRRPILNTMVRDGTWAFILSLGEPPGITMFLGACALTGRAVVMVLNAVIYTVFSETLSGIFYLYVTLPRSASAGIDHSVAAGPRRSCRSL